MTAVPPPAPATGPAQPLASWGARFAAYLLDVVPIMALFVLLTVIFGDSETTSSSFSFQLTGLPFVVYTLLAIGWWLFNWGHLQGSRGQTVGKKVLHIAVHGAATGKPLGFGLSVARQLVHILDALPCYLGFLWPLWDKENRTFADMLMGSRVVKH